MRKKPSTETIIRRTLIFLPLSLVTMIPHQQRIGKVEFIKRTDRHSFSTLSTTF